MADSIDSISSHDPASPIYTFDESDVLDDPKWTPEEVTAHQDFLHQHLGQIPHWDEECDQTVLFRCPRCQGIFVSHTRDMTPIERFQRLRGGELEEQYFASYRVIDPDRLPKQYCYLCSMLAFNVHYRLYETVVGEQQRHIGYLFQVVQKDKNLMLQIRRRDVPYRLHDLYTRWPEDGKRVERTVEFLIGTLSQLSPRSVEVVPEEVIAGIKMDAYDMAWREHMPKRVWSGVIGAVRTVGLYPYNPYAGLAMAGTTTPEYKAQESAEHLTKRMAFTWEMLLQSYQQYLLTCPY